MCYAWTRFVTHHVVIFRRFVFARHGRLYSQQPTNSCDVVAHPCALQGGRKAGGRRMPALS